MRTAYVLIFLLAVGQVNAFGLGSIIAGAIEGVIKGVIGAGWPIAKEGMGAMSTLFQTQIKAGSDFISQMMKKAPNLMGSIQASFGNLMKQGMNMFGGLGASAQNAFKQFTSMFSNGIGGALGFFGGMKPKSQKAVVGVFVNVNRVLVTVTKLKIDSLKEAHKEVPALEKLIQDDHKHPHTLFTNLKSQSPRLSEFLRVAHEKAMAEFKSSYAKLDESAKQGLDGMLASLRLSQKGSEKLLHSLHPEHKKEFGSLFHLMNNAMHVVNAAF